MASFINNKSIIFYLICAVLINQKICASQKNNDTLTIGSLAQMALDFILNNGTSEAGNNEKNNTISINKFVDRIIDTIGNIEEPNLNSTEENPEVYGLFTDLIDFFLPETNTTSRKSRQLLNDKRKPFSIIQKSKSVT